MKRSCIFLLAIALIFILAGAVYAAGNVSVYVDNKAVSFPDQKPYIDGNNRTLVPIRFIAEEMGADVDWDGGKKLVTISQEGMVIELTIGEKRARVNGQWKYFDTNAVIYNDRTMVPLRFISETLGAEVDWDGKTKTVYIYTEKRQEKETVNVLRDLTFTPIMEFRGGAFTKFYKEYDANIYVIKDSNNKRIELADGVVIEDYWYETVDFPGIQGAVVVRQYIPVGEPAVSIALYDGNEILVNSSFRVGIGQAEDVRYVLADGQMKFEDAQEMLIFDGRSGGYGYVLDKPRAGGN